MLKRTFTTIMVALVLQTGVKAQVYVKNTGNTGIGVTAPSAKLEVADGGNASLRVGITSNMSNANTQLLNSLAVMGNNNATTTTSGAVAWDFYNNGNNPSWSGTLIEHMGTAVTGTQYGVAATNLGALVFQNETNGVIASNGANIFISPLGSVSACFLTNGNVGIGTTSPAYKLHVNGDVKANVFRANANNYADYVFDSGYQLPSLNEIKAYIKQNHHLPEVPSEEEVKRDGLNLGEQQVTLLKKIEELTLYVIDQNEKLQAFEKKLNELSKENNKLKQEIKSSKKKQRF